MAKILIVDDAAFMRMMLKDILTKGGYEIAGEAADGVEAVVLTEVFRLRNSTNFPDKLFEF